MRRISLSPIAWRSVTEAGFITGIVATVLSLLGFTGFQFAAIYAVLLIVLSVTIFNVRVYRLRPSMRFIVGHDRVFDTLTTYVRNAEENIWVTRFGKSSINLQHEYFTWSNNKILGQNCKRVNMYRRVIKVDTCDKAEMVVGLIKTVGKSDNFFLRESNLVFFFDLLIVDGRYGFIMFHDPGPTSIIDSALFVGEREMVAKLREIYDGIWRNSDKGIIKEKAVLTDAEINSLVEEYSKLAHTLPV